MANEHSDVAAELWVLAETVLTRLEPMLRQAVDNQRERPVQGCSWCPVCALAALMRGEQHELLTLLATEGATIVAMIRQLIADHSGGPPTPTDTVRTESSVPDDTDEASTAGVPADGAPDTDEPLGRRAGFVPITVTVKDPSSGRAD